LLVEPQNIRNPSEFLDWLWLGVVWAPLVEEWIYRGLVQPRLRESFGQRGAIIACGVLFWISPLGGTGWCDGAAPPARRLVVLVVMAAHRIAGCADPAARSRPTWGLACIDLLLLTQPRLVGSLLGGDSESTHSGATLTPNKTLEPASAQRRSRSSQRLGQPAPDIGRHRRTSRDQ
jgi:hypothetical protein